MLKGGFCLRLRWNRFRGHSLIVFYASLSINKALLSLHKHCCFRLDSTLIYSVFVVAVPGVRFKRLRQMRTAPTVSKWPAIRHLYRTATRHRQHNVIKRTTRGKEGRWTRRIVQPVPERPPERCRLSYWHSSSVCPFTNGSLRGKVPSLV